MDLESKLSVASAVFGDRLARAETLEEKLSVLKDYIDALTEIYYQYVIGKGLLRRLHKPWLAGQDNGPGGANTSRRDTSI